MGKHPTPKRKLAKSAGKQRYAAFQFKARKRLNNAVNLVKCSNCNEMRQAHHMCPKCGHYRGRQVIDMSTNLKDKIKKVSA